MLLIDCEEKWLSLIRIVRYWADELADGTREADLWNDVCRAFNNGLLDDGRAGTNGPRFLLIDKVSGRVLSPKDPQLWRYLRPLGDCIFVSKEAVHDLALWCNKSPPSCCDATKGASQPSRPPGQRAPPMAMITAEIRSEYDRAEAAGEKPPNIREISRAVRLVLQQKAYRRADCKLKNWRRPRSLNVAAGRPGSDGASCGRNRFPQQNSNTLVVNAPLGRNLRCEATKVAPHANVHLMKSE
jgi:hypothetical protein